MFYKQLADHMLIKYFVEMFGIMKIKFTQIILLGLDTKPRNKSEYFSKNIVLLL